MFKSRVIEGSPSTLAVAVEWRAIHPAPVTRAHGNCARFDWVVRGEGAHCPYPAAGSVWVRYVGRSQWLVTKSPWSLDTRHGRVFKRLDRARAYAERSAVDFAQRFSR